MDLDLPKFSKMFVGLMSAPPPPGTKTADKKIAGKKIAGH
jgi:hypothetical protein